MSKRRFRSQPPGPKPAPPLPPGAVIINPEERLELPAVRYDLEVICQYKISVHPSIDEVAAALQVRSRDEQGEEVVPAVLGFEALDGRRYYFALEPSLIPWLRDQLNALLAPPEPPHLVEANAGIDPTADDEPPLGLA